MNDKNQINAIYNKVNTQVTKHEYLLIFLLIIGVALKFLNVQFAGMLTVFILSTIASIYYLSSFATPNEEGLNAFDLFLYKISIMSCSVAILGILFNLQNWPGANQINIIGVLSLSICIIYILLEKRKRPNLKLFSKGLVLRFAVLILISAAFMFDKIDVPV